jgi:hypothetical protein
MKKEITTAFLTLATVFGFAQEATPFSALEQTLPNFGQINAKPLTSIEEKVAQSKSIEEKVVPSKSFAYLRLGVSDAQLPKPDDLEQVIPGLGLGYRVVLGFSGIDISASYNRRNLTANEEQVQTFVYTLPKANYLYYVSPSSNQSFYAGAGAAWGGIKTKDGREFLGLIPNVALGYEMNRNNTIRTFVEVNVSKPALAWSQTGDLAAAYAEASLGAGF